jgi:hypothetical protein
MFLANQRFIVIIFSSVASHRGQPAAKCHPRWQPTRSLAVGCGLRRDSNPGLQDNSLARYHWATTLLKATTPPWATTPPNKHLNMTSNSPRYLNCKWTCSVDYTAE